jgi:hypothetical protein
VRSEIGIFTFAAEEGQQRQGRGQRQVPAVA